LQKTKVAAPEIFRENKKRGTIADSYTFNRVALSREDLCRHVFTPKARLQPAEFLITCAKRLLQQYRHEADLPRCPTEIRFGVRSRTSHYGGIEP
jgi:hypothetical protein